MGDVIRLNRFKRRAHAAQRRRERPEPHTCVVERSRQAAGVTHEVALSYPFFHDLHRVLGERLCAHCPRCSYTRAQGIIDPAPDRALTLDRWQLLLAHERDRVGP